MKTFIKIKKILFLLIFFIMAAKPVLSDDTCIFQASGSDVPPNIVFLLDNGAATEEIVAHPDYDDTYDFTPVLAAPATEGVNGFFNKYGYAVKKSGTKYYLMLIGNDLELSGVGIQSSANAPEWTINGITLTLPDDPSSTIGDSVIFPNPDGSGTTISGTTEVKDDATGNSYFRYSMNYLNWLFFSRDLPDSASYTKYTGTTGADLPSIRKIYYAKKALLDVGRRAANRAKFGIYAFTNDSGASQVLPLKMVVGTLVDPPENNILDVNFKNNVNSLVTTTYSPLAEGLESIMVYFNSPSSGAVDDGVYCQKNFVIIISSGLSSKDQDISTAIDYDGDGLDVTQTITLSGEGVTNIPVNYEGSTYLDDVAYYLYNNDIIGYVDGFQNIFTYTVGFKGDDGAKKFLTNTSNNGNGSLNLYDLTDSEYGKYHYEASNPADLADELLQAINDIISRTSSFTSPVVPIKRTTSGDSIYLAFFKPLETNFWEGNIEKFGLNSAGEIVNQDGTPATWSNGAMKEDADPFWSVSDWSANMTNASRNIYTYLGSDTDLTDASNVFNTSNANITAAVLATYADSTGPIELNNIIGAFQSGELLTGTDSGATATSGTITVANSIPYTTISGAFKAGETVTGGTSGAVGTIINCGTSEIIDYIRGADIYDEDEDTNISENRSVICGDPLHSEPTIINYGDTDNNIATPDKTIVFFGANDGMLHAVNDEDGTEAWAFIPPDLLPKLKRIIEEPEHQYYVDSSPAIFIQDNNQNNIIETISTTIDGTTYPPDEVYLICGERKGGTSYFALDITDPLTPKFKWRIAQTAGSPAADVVIAELGETWAKPEFGRIATTNLPGDTGTDVFFIGGGYDENNLKGRSVLAINVRTGAVVKEFKNDGSPGNNPDGEDNLTYSIPSIILVLNADYDAFTDKLYVGDMGGQIWKIDDGDGDDTIIDKNINNWEAHRLFTALCNETDCGDTVDNDLDGLIDELDTSKFFYPPTVTLENGYNMVFVGSGDREDPCNFNTFDALYAIKDNITSLTADDIINVENPSDPLPDLTTDNGWYLPLPVGEKVLAGSIVFYKVWYATTFSPSNDVCVPGGDARLYALNYLTGEAGFDIDGDGSNDRSITIGGGIPSNPVIVITDSGETKLFVSVGSTKPDNGSGEPPGPGIVPFDPITEPINFFLQWWSDLLN